MFPVTKIIDALEGDKNGKPYMKSAPPKSEVSNTPEAKRAGRPRKYSSNAERMQAFRLKQKLEGQRVELFLDEATHGKIKRLSSEWRCSLSEVVIRAINELEAAPDKHEGEHT